MAASFRVESGGSMKEYKVVTKLERLALASIESPGGTQRSFDRLWTMAPAKEISVEASTVEALSELCGNFTLTQEQID